MGLDTNNNSSEKQYVLEQFGYIQNRLEECRKKVLNNQWTMQAVDDELHLIARLIINLAELLD